MNVFLWSGFLQLQKQLYDQELPLHPLSFINLYLFEYTLLKEAEHQQTESGVVQKAQRKVKKK